MSVYDSPVTEPARAVPVGGEQSSWSSFAARLGRRAVLRRLEGLEDGELTVVDGEEHLRFGRSGPDALRAAVTVRDPRFWSALARGGTVGAGEAYAAGWWDADDLVTVVRLIARNRAVNSGLDAATALPRRLELTARRAGIEDGDRVLELGCGWGSFTLWLAERFPRCRITAVSNSASQRRFIERRCRELGIERVQVITADVNHLDLEEEAGGGFDRVVSVEMFEHVRNHQALLERIHGWLRPGGTLFVHVFCHRHFPYLFEVSDDPGDWMARTFFTGGIMPSPELVLRWQGRMSVRRQWLVDGRHYERTARAWLANLDRNRERVREVLAGVHGEEQADRWVERWRIFFLSVAELFGYRQGSEWMVCHTLFERPGSVGRGA